MSLSDKQRMMADLIREALGNACLGLNVETGDELALDISPSRVVEAMSLLRGDDGPGMDQLVDLCGVDYPERAERFEVVYHLLSLRRNMRLRVRARVAEGKSLPSISGLYPSAGWFEREAFDMFGIVFDGHPDLRRILTDYGFEGYPLRRDFPLSGWKQVRYDDLQRRVVSEPVRLEQDYRAFDAESPWRGMIDVQKRGGGA